MYDFLQVHDSESTQTNVQKREKNQLDDELIDVTITSSKTQFKITTRKSEKFLNVAVSVCDEVGWNLNSTRFIFNGERLQNKLTFLENEIKNNALIEVCFEMVGGKGPSADEIRKMLDEAKSDESEKSDWDEIETTELSSESAKQDYKWYEGLKQQLAEGTLELDKSNYQDQKLLYLLETEYLHPYEIIRLHNVYACWDQLKQWKMKDEREAMAEVKLRGSGQQNSTSFDDKRNRDKVKRSQDSTGFIEDITPNKRMRIMNTFSLNTPSPLKKYSRITEMDLKRISVSVHLWAERKMGGLNFLHTHHLENHHFEDIIEFTGSQSKWKLMKTRTVSQLRSLWRNTFGGKHFYRGHVRTGYENEFQNHDPSVRFCPFEHCKSGIMSPMDIDLFILTPAKKCPESKESPESKKKRQFSSRKLLIEFEEAVDLRNHGTPKFDEKPVIEEPANPQEIDVILEEKDSRIIENKDKKNAVIESCDTNIELLIEFEESVDLRNHEKPKFDEKLVFEEPANPQDVIIEEIDSRNIENRDKKSDVIEICDTNIICKIDNCGKSFITFFGLERHRTQNHSNAEFKKEESGCPICAKKVLYLDKHMRAKHSDVKKQLECEVCQLVIAGNMQKHRKICNTCRYCDYSNSKKARLLKHIEKCPLKTLVSFKQTLDKPLDLRSPLKLNSGTTNESDAANCDTSKGEELLESKENRRRENEHCSKVHVNHRFESKLIEERESLEEGRLFHPFDEGVKDEDYFSEIDLDDTDEFTAERRRNKDVLELQLREIDDLKNPALEGDTIIIEKFLEFMRKKRNRDVNDGGFSKQTEPTTINIYAGVVKNDILRAFHKLIIPFDARWLIDCKSPKLCKFEGEERLYVKPEEPIYMTSRILQEALSRHEASGNSGNEKKKVISTFVQMMDFVELHFTLKLNAYGVDVLNRVLTYHQGVKSYIKGTSQWKKNNDEERDGYEKNKKINDYECPNKDVDVLENYTEYVKSEDRISRMSNLLSFSFPDGRVPPPSAMSEFGTNVMEEIVACTGCRPKVVRHLPLGAFVDAKPGFNPDKIGKEDKTVEVDVDGDRFQRRVNPNLPPAGKGCIHQLKERKAICPENCDKQCVPEGYNIWVTWDKTQSSKGPYFLHIPKPIKELMDRYDIIRTNYFRDKKPKFSTDEHWLENPDTPFFLNSQCGIFPSLNLRKLSSILGIDMVAYNFRKIVSTWALSHKSEDIRKAEEEALQHSLHVAKERYLQSKQVQPQNLVQTYSQEENLFPEKFRNELARDHIEIKTAIAKKQDDRAKVRHSQLSKEKVLSKKIKFENRVLGPRTAVLESDRREFIKIFERLSGNKMEAILASFKPIQYRDLVVRVVCSFNGEDGDRLRQLWQNMYKGDLQYGIRDLRRQAKEQKWPLRKQTPGRRDRNSWIAHFLRRSCQTASKFDDN